MRGYIRYITRKSRGDLSIRNDVQEGDHVIAGRGNDCGISLPDPRVLLNHAEFAVRGGTLYVGAMAGADVRVNGNLTQLSRVDPGDKVKLGPYEITVEDPASDGGFVVSVELVQSLGNDLQELVARSRIEIARVGLSMRGWSWALGLLVLLLTFSIPFVGILLGSNEVQTSVPGEMTFQASAGQPWSTGSISAVHKFFGTACETCHERPFIQVRNIACVNCHEDIQNHVDPATFPFADIREQRCATCHKEHQGNRTIALADEVFCASCHASLTSMTQMTNLKDAGQFGGDHPAFRPTVTIDPIKQATDRSRAIGDNPNPHEISGLKFPHEKHLRPSGVKDPERGTVVLQCRNCHTPDDGAVSMQPIAYEQHCQGCHQMKFDTFVSDRNLPHGSTEQLFKQVRDIYDGVAMRGGYEEPEAPALVRRRPGTALQPEQKKAVSDWAMAKTAAIVGGRFGRGLCEECHATYETVPSHMMTDTDPLAVAQNWSVAPVRLPQVWLPKARFAHEAHRDVLCTTCHDAPTSIAATDVLMPKLSICQSCHGGESAADRVPSTCTTCHKFHRGDLPPMHGAAVKTTKMFPAANGAHPERLR